MSRPDSGSRKDGSNTSPSAFFRAAMLAVLLLMLAASAQAGGTLHRGLGPGPDALDIHLAQSLAALNVLRDVHEGLVTFDADARLIPGIARDWRIAADGLTWTFELDPSARWSDGTPIVAADFVAGWRRLLDPATAAPTAGLLDAVVNAEAVRDGKLPSDALGVAATAPDRLEVRLTRPVPWFGELLTHPATFAWPGEGRQRFSGPFVLEAHVPGASVRLRANPSYREAEAVALEAVVWHIIEEPTVELNRYRAGQLHMTESVPPGRLDWLREQFGEQLRITPYLGSFFLAFNLSREPFRDQPELRRALSLVIDRELLTERVLGTGEVPAERLIPPGMPGWADPASVEPARLDDRITRAQALYRQAGYSRRRPLTVELRFNSTLSHRRMAAAVAAMWREHLGVRTRQVNEEWKVFVANRRQGRITEIVRGGWIADWRDAANFLQLFESDSPLNYTFWSDERFDRRMDRARLQSGSERLATLRAAEDRLLEQQVIVPLYYYVSRHLVKPDVQGFNDNLMDLHLSRWLALP